MNRQERRKLERKYGVEYSMQRYREDTFNTGFKEGVNSTYCVVMNMVAYSLNYKLNLGKKRLPELMKTIADNIDSYRTGQLDAEDYKEIKKIVQNLGIIVEMK
jgi:hypothetical protein